jgi:predicted methyltransferase
MTTGGAISKNITINRDNIDVIILKMGFTFNSNNIININPNDSTSINIINLV